MGAAVGVRASQLEIDPAFDIGRFGCGWVEFLAAGVNAADTITVGGTDVWTAVNGAPATDWQWTRSAATGAADATAFAARVNLNAASQVRAVELTVAGNVGCVALFAKTIAAGNLALAESTGSARTIVSAAAQVGSTALADKRICGGIYTVTAADVACWAAAGSPEIAIAAVPSTSQPWLINFDVQVGGVFRTPATMRAIFRQSGANEWVLAVQDAAAVVVAADVIIFACMTN